MASHSQNQGQLLGDIAFGVRHGAFDDRLGKSLLRAWSVGAADDPIRQMIFNRVRTLRAREAFGTLDPFMKPQLSDGDVTLGVDGQGREIRIPLQWLVAGLLVAGNTGSGKSNLLGSLVSQIVASGCHVWISDMYKTQVRQWRPLFQSLGRDLIVLRGPDWKFNLLQPGDCHPRGHMAMVIDLLIRRLDLPPRARTILLQGCHYLYQKFSIWEARSNAYPCLFDLYEWVRSASNLNAAAREAILDRLGALLTALTPRTAAYRYAWNPTDLERFTIDFEMRGTTEVVRQVLLESTLYSVMQHQVERGLVNARMNLFVAFEDSQRFFDSQQRSSSEITPMDELAGVIRGSGKGLGVIVQTMQGLSKRLEPNLATKIMGRLGSHDDYARLGADLAMNAKQVEWARRKLKPGMFVAQVSEGDWREPFLVSVPLLKIPAVVSDEEATQSVRALEGLPTVPAEEYADWQPQHIIHASMLTRNPPTNHNGHSDGDQSDTSRPANGPSETSRVTMEVLEYLRSIALSPFLGATERDRALGLSVWKGNRIRAELTATRLVRAIAINPGGRGKRFQLLELTGDGLELLKSLGIQAANGHGRGGIEHQFWCRTISEWATGEGIECVIEDDSRGARVDIAMETPNWLVAIEVETSPGHEIQNIKKDLDAGFDRVVTLVKEPSTVVRLQTRLETDLGTGASSVCVGCLMEYAELVSKQLRICLGEQDEG